METVKVMAPYLPDDERADRLAELRQGQVELTYIEKLVLETAKGMMQEGKKVTVRGVKDALPNVPEKKAEAALRHIREQGLLDNQPVLEGVVLSQE